MRRNHFAALPTLALALALALALVLALAFAFAHFAADVLRDGTAAPASAPRTRGAAAEWWAVEQGVEPVRGSMEHGRDFLEHPRLQLTAVHHALQACHGVARTTAVPLEVRCWPPAADATVRRARCCSHQAGAGGSRGGRGQNRCEARCIQQSL